MASCESEFRDVTDKIPAIPDEEVPASAVLVVDDQEDLATVVALSLSRKGLKTYIATSAAEALRTLGDNDDIGVLLTDLKMPVHDGTWLIDRVEQRYPDVRIAVMSAYHKDYPSLARRVKAIFQKPFDRQPLATSIIGLAVNL